MTAEGVLAAQEDLKKEEAEQNRLALRISERDRLDDQTRQLLAEASAPGASDATVLSSGRKAAIHLAKVGDPWTRTTAERALVGNVEDMRAYLSTGRLVAADEDDRARVQHLGSSGKSAVKAAADAALNGTPENVREFLRTRQYQGKSEDARIEAVRLGQTGGPALKAAARAALEGTEAELIEFIENGQQVAAAQDDRIKIVQIRSAGGAEVKAAAQVALSGPRSYQRYFLSMGQFKAQRRDQETATHIERVRGYVAEAAQIAATARQNAAEAARVAAIARQAADDAARYANEAQASANQAAEHAKTAAAAAQAAQTSANQAAASARTARNAAASARASAQAAEASAAEADRSATRARSYADEASRSAEAAKNSALAAGKSQEEAAAAAKAANDHAITRQRAEDAAKPGGNGDQWRWNEPDPASSPLRPGNIANGNNDLAMAMALAGGGTCKPAFKQMICFNTKTLNGRPMTVGDYLLYPWSEADLNGALNAEAAKRKELYDKGINADVYGPDLLRHEAVHSDQWQNNTPETFLSQYWAGTGWSWFTTPDGDDGVENPWEKEANLYHGGYLEFDNRKKLPNESYIAPGPCGLKKCAGWEEKKDGPVS